MSGNEAKEAREANEAIRREQRHEHRRLPPDIMGPRSLSTFAAELDVAGRRKDAVDDESLDRPGKKGT